MLGLWVRARSSKLCMLDRFRVLEFREITHNKENQMEKTVINEMEACMYHIGSCIGLILENLHVFGILKYHNSFPVPRVRQNFWNQP